MKKPYLVRTIILAASLLLQLNTLCFHSHAAANDNFANAQIISGFTGSTSGNNAGTTKEPGEPEHAGNAGGSSVWFRWLAPTNGLFTFTTAGSDFDTVLAVYTGASVNALTLVNENDDASSNFTSAVSFPATTGITYYVAVDGFDGETGVVLLNWEPTPVPINDNFANATLIAGPSGEVSGSTAAATKEPGEPNHAGNAGGSSVWFRWTAPTNGQYSFSSGGSDFDSLLAVYTGVSVNTLSLVGSNDNFSFQVDFPATGGTTYSVAVDGFDGAAGVLWLDWSLEVDVHPANDNFADATQITGPAGNVSGNSTGATKEPGEPNHADEAGGRSVWFRWTAPADGQYSFTTAGSGFYTLLAVYTGTSVNALSLVAGNDGFDGDPVSLVNFPATAGTTYHVAVDGLSAGFGQVELIWGPSTTPPELPFTTLHSFTNGLDGINPRGGLVVSGNTLFGTASSGGNPGGGTVFAVNTDGTSFRLVHSFTGGSDGGTPYAELTLSGSTLYGTTWVGGSSGYGTVFAVSTNGTGFTNLHSFTTTFGSLDTNSGGANPYSGLILSGNTLYGTTWHGGTSGGGTLFGVSTNGTGFTNLHSFTATSGSPATNSDGSIPSGSLILSSNTLYGTAIEGGSLGYGTAFAVQTNGTGFTTLHSFDWSGEGAWPQAIIMSGSTLHGTARGGGRSGSGTVFAMQTNGAGFTNLYDFKGVSGAAYLNLHGADPVGLLLLTGELLYGVAPGGGSGGKGTVFAIHTNGTGITTLHNFTATTGLSATNSDGAYSQAGLILSRHALYGTAERGGSSGYGTVFSISLPPPQLEILPSGASLILSWPINAGEFALQSTTNLFPAAWSAVAQPAVTNASQISVTVPATVGRKFFRLKLQ